MAQRQYQYDVDYRDTLVVDGMNVRFRLLTPEDAALLKDGFAHLSAKSRRSRFLGGKQRLSDKEVEYLTNLDNENHLAIAAVEVISGGQERGLGVARFVRFPRSPDRAEVAVTVIDEAQHHGLGGQLCRRLFAAARERGIRTLHFEILAGNAPMVSLLHELVPAARQNVECGVISAEVPIAEELDRPGDSASPVSDRR
jgi:GNAT superfamily N-acetyltransferase